MSKSCFFIGRIGKAGSLERKQSDHIFQLIEQATAVKEFDYKCDRADLIKRTGEIPQQIISNLLDADLVIADLSGSNPNVFYELGIRHATNKPFIQITNHSEKEKVPFDVGYIRYLEYEYDIASQSMEDKDERKFNKELTQFLKQIEVNPEGVKSPAFNIQGTDLILPLRTSNFFKKEKNKLNSSLGKLIFKSEEAIRFFSSSDNWKAEMLDISQLPFYEGAEAYLSVVTKNIGHFKNGEIRCSGDLINSIFSIFIKQVNKEFIAISVNDLDFWLTKGGNSYLDVILKHRENKKNVNLERTFILEKGKYFEPGGLEENIFINQINNGYHLRFIFQSDLKSFSDHIDDGIQGLDFGLFDNYAVSFFRPTDGRTFIISTNQEECVKRRQYYKQVIEYSLDKALVKTKKGLYKILEKYFRGK